MRRVEMKKQYIVAGLLFIIAIVTVGYAILRGNLNISGTVTTRSNSWSVHFNNVQMNQESVNKTAPTISNGTSLNFNVELAMPGDLYGFTVDAVNDGTIDAKMGRVNVTALTTEQAKLIDLSITYNDGTQIQENDELKANSTKRIKVLVKYKDDINPADLPNNNVSINVTFAVDYVQADENAKETEETLTQVSFAEDSWETIQKAVQSGDYIYQVGDIKTVDMGALGTHTVRISNTTECTNGETSETACGFVVEFADVVEKHNMNNADATNTYGTNVGGWKDSAMRSYLNETLYNALPSDLKEVIVNTKVVSGHGETSGETNFTTTDKLYLLSAHEVWGDDFGFDTSYDETRQLDYYANLGVTTNNYSGAVKQYNGSSSYWWLRSASSNTTTDFLYVRTDGNWSYAYAYSNSGVSPAFRIA